MTILYNNRNTYNCKEVNNSLKSWLTVILEKKVKQSLSKSENEILDFMKESLFSGFF